MDNPAPASASNIPSVDALNEEALLAGHGQRVSVDQLLLAGAHFGHLTQRWNPKMKRFIFMARNGIYLIDLQKTQAMLEAACTAMTKVAAAGEEILFIGTKKQARDIIESEAKRCHCSFVTYRWLGGTLTNFATIRKSLRTLETYEKMAADGTYEKLTKKEQLTIEKDKAKLMLGIGGIREMRRLPGAVFIVDTKRESIAVSEARKLNIPIFAIVDTNVDPDLVDHPVPANDDAFKSIWLITHALADAIVEGRRAVKTAMPGAEEIEERDRDRDRPRGDRQQRRRRGGPGGPGGSRPERVEGVRNEGGDRTFRTDNYRSDRPRGDRPAGDRPRPDRPAGDRPPGDRPRGDRPPGDRPASDRQAGDRPRSDRPAGDRPAEDRPPRIQGESGSAGGSREPRESKETSEKQI